MSYGPEYNGAPIGSPSKVSAANVFSHTCLYGYRPTTFPRPNPHQTFTLHRPSSNCILHHYKDIAWLMVIFDNFPSCARAACQSYSPPLYSSASTSPLESFSIQNHDPIPSTLIGGIGSIPSDISYRNVFRFISSVQVYPRLVNARLMAVAKQRRTERIF